MRRRGLVALRREIHSYPELGFEERRTAARVAEFWFPRAEGFGWYAYSLWIVTALSLAGFGLLAWRRRRVTR